MSGRDGAAFLVAVTVLKSGFSARAVLFTRCCLLSELVLTGAADDRLLDDDRDSVVATGGTDPTSTAETIALDCAPPVLCARPLRGSSVTVDPTDVVAVTPVEPLDAGSEVNTPAEEPLDVGSSEPVAAVPEGVVPVDEVSPLDEVSPIDVVLAVGDESVPDEPESVGSAHATPGVVAIATPTPNATANPPTRPMYLALVIVVPFANHACEVVTCCANGGRATAWRPFRLALAD